MFRECATLIKYGIAFDVAWSLSDEDRLAYLVAFGEIEGGTWDWDRMHWAKED